MKRLFRGRRSPLLCAFFLALAVIAVREQPAARPDADARITFYQARIGGPATYPAYARLGAAYVQTARETGRAEYYAQAERHLEKSLRFQRNHEALRWLAAAYIAQHKFRPALPYAREAVSAMPADLESQGTLFDAYLGLQERGRAARVLDTMLAQGPSFAALARLSALRHSDGKLGGAVEAMESACAIAEATRVPAETRAWCHVQLGFLYSRSGKPKAADESYARALTTLPGYHHALQHRAELREAPQSSGANALRARLLPLRGAMPR